MDEIMKSVLTLINARQRLELEEIVAKTPLNIEEDEPSDFWGKLLDRVAIAAALDRLLFKGYIIKRGPYANGKVYYYPKKGGF